VVVGDVQPAQVYALAKQYFGLLSPSTLTPPKPRPEVPQLGNKRLSMHLTAQLPMLLLGYKVPTLAVSAPEAQWEVYALQVLAEVLSSDNSARLEKSLVRDQAIAVLAYASYNPTARLTTLFQFGGVPSEQHSVEALEQAFYAEIAQLKTTLIDAEELQRIKNQLRAAEVFEQDSMFYQGMRMGLLETIGLDWRLLEDYLTQIALVTPEQVQQVARTYLRDELLTVGVLHPLPAGGANTAEVTP
jgi:zinc protease